jgi:hypothetical protein
MRVVAIPWMFPSRFPECSLNVPSRFARFLPVLSTSPIDYYDGRTVRLNTKFYSWDTSFGLVNPRPRYSCLQVVFSVNLGTFLKCFLQLGWRLTGVRSTLPECSLNVLRMFPECSLVFACRQPSLRACVWWPFPVCSLNVLWMFTECSLNVPYYLRTGGYCCGHACGGHSLYVPWMFPKFSLMPVRFAGTFLPVLSTSPIDYYDGGTVRLNTEFYSWDTSFGLVNSRPRYSCLQVVFCVNLGTFLKCFLQLGWRLTGIRSTLPECSLTFCGKSLCMSALRDSHADVASSLPPRRSAGRAFALVHCGTLIQTLPVCCLWDVLREYPLHECIMGFSCRRC